MSRLTVFYCRCGARLVGASARVEHRCPDPKLQSDCNATENAPRNGALTEATTMLETLPEQDSNLRPPALEPVPSGAVTAISEERSSETAAISQADGAESDPEAATKSQSFSASITEALWAGARALEYVADHSEPDVAAATLQRQYALELRELYTSADFCDGCGALTTQATRVGRGNEELTLCPRCEKEELDA